MENKQKSPNAGTSGHKTKKTLDSILSQLKNVGKSKEGFLALCPAHNDRNPSLSIKRADNKILLHCFAGCNIDDICRSISITKSDLFINKPNNVNKKNTKEEEITYSYTDENGKTLFQVVRYPGKKFRQRRPDGKGNWIYNLNDTQRVLYHLPEVMRAVEKGETVYIAEGEKDVTSLVEKELIATTSPGGAQKWRKEYSHYLKDAKVIILPDNDEPGHKHAEQIASSLNGIASSLKIVKLPDLSEKGDVTDWFQDGHTKHDLFKIVEETSEWEPTELDTEKYKSRYFLDDDGFLCRIKSTQHGEFPVRLSNFDAVIQKQITEDDGVDEILTFKVEVKQKNSNNKKFQSLGIVEVPATKFNSLNWVSMFGNNAIIEPGYTTKDYIRHAIQTRSSPEIERIFTHTGWTWIDNKPVYLTSSGAIGKDSVSVKLSEELQRYDLPIVKHGNKAIETSLSFLEIGDIEITLPLYLTTFLAPLTTLLKPQPGFVLYLYGPSGSFKTTLSLLAQSHFGKFTSIQDLDSFESTVNHLGKRSFTLKDMLMVIDDYHPSSSISDARRIESTVQHIIRRIANRTERGRLNPNATEKKRYTPRATVVITGEELVTVQSTLARTFVLELELGSIDIRKLTELQNKSRHLPYAMSSYINWIRENMSDILENFKKEFTKIRAEAGSQDLHLRIPETVAFLYFTAIVLSNWLQEKKLFDENQAKEFLKQSWEVLIKIGQEQQKRISKEDPVEKFQDILEALLLQKKVHLLKKTSDRRYYEADDSPGDMIGYYDEEYYYLLPTPLWRAIQIYTRESNEYFSVSRRAFYKMLREKKIIVINGKENLISQRLQDRICRVLKVYKNKLKFDVTDVTEDENDV